MNKYARKIHERFTAVIPWDELPEDLKAKKSAGRQKRPLVFGRWTTAQEAEEAGKQYVLTGIKMTDNSAKPGFEKGKFTFKMVEGKKTLVSDPVEIAKLNAAKKENKRQRDKIAWEKRKVRNALKKGITVTAIQTQPIAGKLPTVAKQANNVSSKKLNASQLDELKQALKFVAKHKRRSSQLITIRAQHVAALTAELPNNVRVEIENQKWIYLKPKK